MAVLALANEVGFLLGFGGSHSLPQARHGNQESQTPDNKTRRNVSAFHCNSELNRPYTDLLILFTTCFPVQNVNSCHEFKQLVLKLFVMRLQVDGV